MIEQLPLLPPDPQRSERTAAKCRERLARRRQRLAQARPAGVRSLAIERALVGALCLLYVSAVVLTAVQVVTTR